MGLPVPDEYFHNNPGAAAGGPGSGSGSGVALKTEPMDSDAVVGDEEALIVKGGDGRGSSGGKDGKDKDGGKDGDEAGGVVKANKGMILRKSVEYIRSVFDKAVQIFSPDVFFAQTSNYRFFSTMLTQNIRRYLQQLVTAQGARNRELERELRTYRGGPVNPNSSSSSSNTPNAMNTLNPMNTIDPGMGGNIGEMEFHNINQMNELHQVDHPGGFDSMNPMESMHGFNGNGSFGGMGSFNHNGNFGTCAWLLLTFFPVFTPRINPFSILFLFLEILPAPLNPIPLLPTYL